jgi:hypothetical protein
MKSPSANTKASAAAADSRGYALTMVMGLLLILGLMGSGMLAMSTSEGMLYSQAYLERQAFYLAEAGSQRLIARLAKSETWTGTVGYDDESLGTGEYSVVLNSVSETAVTFVATGACFPDDERLTRTYRLTVTVER